MRYKVVKSNFREYYWVWDTKFNESKYGTYDKSIAESVCTGYNS